MSRRVVLGTQADGSIRLRVAAAGFDALTSADDGAAITFDTGWTDIAKLYVVGLVGWAANAFTIPGGSTPSNGYTAAWPSLGYKPFLEIGRVQSGVVVFDDFWNSTFTAGAYAIIDTTAFYAGEPASTSDIVLYAVYQIPVPSG